MRVLFDLYHPSHVHLFKNAIWELETEGHDVLVTSRDKEVTIDLLEAYDIEHVTLSAKRRGTLGILSESGLRFAKMVRVARRFEPDIVAGRINPVSVAVAKLAGASNVMFKDSDYTTLISKVTHPFVDMMYIPANFDLDLGEMEHRVDGFQELAYLHPNWFEPKKDLLEKQGISPENPYFVLRFVAMDAHHDGEHNGFSLEAKRELVSLLSERGDVYITSEDSLPDEFEEHRLPIPPDYIHHLLSYADIYIGDSQTMATEAALLGTPSIRSNSFAGNGDLSNFVELEKEYELLFSFADEDDAIQKVKELIDDQEVHGQWQERRQQLVEEKVDVTEDMVELFYQIGGAE